MTNPTSQKEVKALLIPPTKIPDFATLLSQVKNYRRAGVSRIVPRDAYRPNLHRHNNNHERKKDVHHNEPLILSSSSSLNNSNNNHCKIVYKVDDDGISFVPNDRVDAIINGDVIADEIVSTDCDYYILNVDKDNNDDIDVDENDLPDGYTKQDYFLDEILNKNARIIHQQQHLNNNNFYHYYHDRIEYLQTNQTIKNNDEETKSQDKNSGNYISPNTIKISDLVVSKTPLLLQDQIDIEASTFDTIKMQEASRLAYQLSLRTAVCSNLTKSEPKAQFDLSASMEDTKNEKQIVVSTLSLKDRQRLEQRRRREEAALPYYLHGIELQGWESKINWEGACSGDSNQDDEATCSNGEGTESSYPDPHDILSQAFNTSFEGMNLSELISWDGADAKPGFNAALGRELGKIVLQDTVAATSVLKTSGALPNPNPRPFNQSEEFKNRMERKNMGVSSGPVSSLQMDRIKLNKEIEEKQKRRAQREFEKTKRIKDVLKSVGALNGGTGRAITSSLMGPGGTERTGRPTRHHGSSLAYDLEYIEQLEMINNHSLAIADMSPIELRHYGRPLLPKTIFKSDEIIPWQLQSLVTPRNKVMDGNNSSGSTYRMVNVIPGSISQSKIRNPTDLSPLEGPLVLIEYCEEKLPLKLMKGMASKIVNYYKGDKSKCPISAGGGDIPTKKKTHGLTNQDSELKGSSGKVEKPPRLEGPDSTTLNTKDLIGKISQKKHLDGNKATNASITKLPEGVTEILKDHGPFLGKVTDGTTQTGLVNNLFVAPMVRHEPKSTDFLMMVGKPISQNEGSSRLGVILRSMPENIFIAGQTEPKRKVFAPDSKGDKDFVTPFVTYQIAKALQIKKAKDLRGLKFEEIKDGLFPFTDIPANPLRQRIKKVGIYDKNTQIWTLKPIGFEEFDGVENLGRSFTPESVAAYWSARCAEQYLRDIGLQEISSMTSNLTNIGIAMNYLSGIKDAARKRKNIMNKLAKSQSKSKNHDLFEKAKEKLLEKYKEIERKFEVANFIHEELQITPWNLTSDFMDVHRNPQGSGTMQLTGIGDPSGVSAGFNFMRVTERGTKPSGKNNNKITMTAVSGTDKDLRKLSMKEMARILLEEYAVQPKHIATLGRWDRVHMIRELSTKAASDNAGDGMERYARGEKIKLRDKIDSYKKRIQEIWERQLTFLREVEEEISSDKPEPLLKENTNLSDVDNDDEEEEEDDDEEDDYVKMLQDKMQDTKKKHELVRGEVDINNLRKNFMKPSQDTSEDAGALAAFMREREENLALTDIGTRQDAKGINNRFRNMNKKVIRKKIIKTHPDGTQEVKFKFIINCDEETIIKVTKESAYKKFRGQGIKKKGSKQSIPPTRHSMFEEDVTSIKIIPVRRKAPRARGKRHDDDYIPPSRSKLIDSHGKGKIKSEKKKHKRKRDEDEDDIYMRPILMSRSSSNRRVSARELKPHAKLAERLENIRYDCEKRPHSGPFHRPVDRVAFPKYYEVISNPIDLQTIRDKIKRYEYRTADAFIKDFEVMKHNAIKFNGYNHIFAVEATKIYNFVKSTVEANRDDFTSIEIAVEEQFNSGLRKRPRSLTPKEVEDSIGNSASVVTVDGIEQRVYLGDLQGPFGGSNL